MLECSLFVLIRKCFIHTFRYFNGFSAAHLKSLPNLANVLNGVKIPTGASHVETVKAVGGSLTFTHLTKNSKWDDNLWSALVAPTLKEDLMVESWIRGSAVGKVCKPYKVVDVISLAMHPPSGENGDAFEWLESQDHAKWAVGMSKTKKWFCIGDINRMTTQQKRGGGALCFQSAAVYNRMSGAITDVDKC